MNDPVTAVPSKKKVPALKESIEDLLNVGENFKSIEPVELKLPVTELDEVKGWWVALRGAAMAKCMVQYLAIMRKQNGITLNFIDLQAGPGLLSVPVANPWRDMSFRDRHCLQHGKQASGRT